MFWGLIMEPRRRYSQEVTRPFHVSMASLDISSCTDDPVQLMVMFQKRNYLLCTLQKGFAVQVPLDLNFESGDEVSFTINGASHIHLTGYHIEDNFDDIPDDEEEDELKVEEEDEDEDLSENNIVYGKRKQTISSNTTPRESTGLSDMIGDQWNILQGGPVAKRSKTLELLGATLHSDDDDSDDEDVVFSDLGEDGDEDGETTMDSLDDDGLEEEEEDSDEEVEEESEEELEKVIVQKKQKNKERPPVKQVVEVAQKQRKEQMKKGDGKKGQQQQQQQQQQLDGVAQSGKKKKKNKQQGQNTSAAEANVNAKEKKQEQNKMPKADKKQQSQQNTPQKKFVDRGVTIEEITLGGGPTAKTGKFAHLYYEGRLKQNNKVFDSAVKGPPFKFRLGTAEVIKGWDVGVAGMKVGGKRRISVPPQMAYGSKGVKPDIPPNSTLIFDLELKNVT